MATNYVAKTPSSTTNWNKQMAKASVTLSAGAAVGNAFASWAAMKREKAIAKQNAKLAEAAAQDALARGRMAQFALRLKQAQTKGTQRAALAANGVALDSATAQDLQAGTDFVAGMDATTIENNARREAYGYRMQASNYQAAAQAANPMSAGFGSLMEGAASVAAKWQANTQTFGSDWSKSWFSRGG